MSHNEKAYLKYRSCFDTIKVCEIHFLFFNGKLYNIYSNWDNFSVAVCWTEYFFSWNHSFVLRKLRKYS